MERSNCNTDSPELPSLLLHPSSIGNYAVSGWRKFSICSYHLRCLGTNVVSLL